MKFINYALFVFLLCLTGSLVHAQWAFNGNNIYNTNAGYVGIGTTTPTAPLSVSGEIKVGLPNGPANGIMMTSQSILGVVIQQGNIGGDFVNGNNYYSIYAHDMSYDGTHWIRRNQYSNAWAMVLNSQFYDIQFAPADGNGQAFTAVTPTTLFRINAAGNVGIGTTNPGTNKLAVEGTIGARAVKVTLQNPWPDYVFSNNYKLPSLTSLHQYILANHRLPGMPSADSVAANGIDLGTNQALLLKKIEELTLYVIDQQKQLATQQEQINQLMKGKKMAAGIRKKSIAHQ